MQNRVIFFLLILLFVACEHFIPVKKNDIKLTDSLHEIAKNNLENNQIDSAIFLYQQILLLQPSDTIVYYAYHNLGTAHLKKKHFDSAFHYYKKANDQAIFIKDSLNITLTALATAIAFKKNGAYANSIKYFDFARNYFETNCQDCSELPLVYNYLGNIYKDLDNYKRAKYYFNQSLYLLNKSTDKKQLPATYNNLGLLFYQFNQYDSALLYFNQYKKFSQNNHSKQARALMNLGKTYTKLNQLKLAKSHIDTSLLLYNTLKDSFGILESNICLAEWNFNNNNIKETQQLISSLKKQTNINSLPLSLLDLLPIEKELYFKTNDIESFNQVNQQIQLLTDSIKGAHKMAEIYNADFDYLNTKNQNYSSIISIKNTIIENHKTFIGLLIALAIGIIYVINNKRRNEKVKNEINKEGLEQKIEDERKKRLIQSGLNIGKFQPQHALAGVLNDINALIEHGELEAAKSKANEVGVFLRKLIYTKSENNYLKNEIENIQTLLDFESKQKNFEYHFKVEDSIYAIENKVVLPSLILYVPLYNAIEYAIGHTKNGYINIELNYIDEQLILKIEDTGKKSLVVEHHIEDYRGIGTKLMNEYLDIVKQLTGREGSFKIEEKWHNFEKTGNTSALIIPVNLQ